MPVPEFPIALCTLGLRVYLFDRGGNQIFTVNRTGLINLNLGKSRLPLPVFEIEAFNIVIFNSTQH